MTVLKYRNKILIHSVNLLSDLEDFKDNIFVKVRSTGKLLEAKINFSSKNIATVNLVDPEYGISPGQACVFYKKDQFGDRVLGGGWITEN